MPPNFDILDRRHSKFSLWIPAGTTATPKLAQFSPDLRILDALEYKREGPTLMLASICIALTREHVARLRNRNAVDDSAVQDIDVSELRRGKFYCAFILSMASLQVSQALIDFLLDHL